MINGDSAAYDGVVAEAVSGSAAAGSRPKAKGPLSFVLSIFEHY